MFLNCHTYYSFKYGTLSPERLLQQAENLGLEKLAITDINNTSGCWESYRLAQKKGMELAFGVDFRNQHERKYILLAKDLDGFEEINRHLSEHARSGKPFPDRAPQCKNTYVIYPFRKDLFFDLKENEWIGVQYTDLNAYLTSVWQHYPQKCLALLSVNFITRKDFQAHRLLRAMDQNALLTHLDIKEIASHTQVLMPEHVARERFSRYPYLLDNSKALLNNCHIQLDFKQPKNKATFSGNALTDIKLLCQKAEAGAIRRYGSISDELKNRMDKELDIIIQKKFVSYFLINEDLVQFSKNKGFFHVGRGSGANSLIAYCLGITNVNPIELDLYFERFINLYRESPPDFDLDFSWKDRDQVIQYMIDKYGDEHACQLAAYNTIQTRSAIRELCKVAGLPKFEAEELIAQFGKKEPEHKVGQNIYLYTQHLADFPSHLSIHAGGILISDAPIYRYTAIDIPPKGFPVSRFDMHTAEDIGLYKFDILSQRGLGHIKDTVIYVKERHKVELDIEQTEVFKVDPEINAMMSEGNTMGCFYVESPAMRTLLKKMQCNTYLDLVAASSIIRPGVARSGMMREFIMRHRFVESRKNAHPRLLEIMPDTYGVMVYQEDVIKVAHHFAGLSLAEADVLRRGMSGKYRSREEFQKLEDRYFENCKRLGHSDEEAKAIWFQIESFAGYSFAKGHSASFAVESYQSLFLKLRYPLEFYTAVLNNFGGFYRSAFYVNEARRHGAIIERPCINHGEYLCALKGPNSLYLGFILVQNLEQKLVIEIVDERNRGGRFANLEDFVERMRKRSVLQGLEQLLILIRMGALRSFGLSKHELLWKAHLLHQKSIKSKPVAGQEALFTKPRVNDFSLPSPDTGILEEVKDELDLLGFPVQLTYFDLVSGKPDSYTRVRDMKIGQQITMLGWLVTVKPTRTVKGDRMYFGTFLDEDNEWIDSVHFPPVAAQYPFTGEGVYVLHGRVMEEFGLMSLEVYSMHKLALK